VTEVHVKLTEFKVDLDKTSIPAGPVKFVTVNAGTLVHEIVLEPAGATDQPLEANGKVAEAEDIEVGQSATLEWTLDTPGELSIHRGANVAAKDGRVGKVDEFLVDLSDGHITHLVLREGHLWGQRDVTIPISEIERIEEDTVHLKLDRHSVQRLPGIPVKRWYDRLSGE